MAGGSVFPAQIAECEKAVPLEFVLMPYQTQGAIQFAVCQWDFKKPACGNGIGGQKAADDGDAQTGFRRLEQCLGVAHSQRMSQEMPFSAKMRSVISLVPLPFSRMRRG